LVLTAVNLSIGPIITKTIGSGWGVENCKVLDDGYDQAKKGSLTDAEKKYDYEFFIDRCKNQKAMHDMEYTSFIFDIVIGFVCSLIGLLHLFDLKKDFVSNTGLIGLICGVVAFALTFVYVILNGIVYTKYYEDPIFKTDGDGVFAEKSGDNYECIYFDEEGNYHALLAKYSDLGKKQYNYNKDLSDSFGEGEAQACEITVSCPLESLFKESCSAGATDPISICSQKSYPVINLGKNYNGKPCEKLYLDLGENEITNKDLSDRFLTTLILSLFVCLASIGLALFGFLLFRTPGDF
jgi:hypothetical protein